LTSNHLLAPLNGSSPPKRRKANPQSLLLTTVTTTSKQHSCATRVHSGLCILLVFHSCFTRYIRRQFVSAAFSSRSTAPANGQRIYWKSAELSCAKLNRIRGETRRAELRKLPAQPGKLQFEGKTRARQHLRSSVFDIKKISQNFNKIKNCN